MPPEKKKPELETFRAESLVIAEPYTEKGE